MTNIIRNALETVTAYEEKFSELEAEVGQARNIIEVKNKTLKALERNVDGLSASELRRVIRSANALEMNQYLQILTALIEDGLVISKEVKTFSGRGKAKTIYKDNTHDQT